MIKPMKVIRCLCLLAIIFPGISEAMSMTDAWVAAKKNSPELSQAELDIRMSESGKDISRSALLPSLALGSSVDWNEQAGNSHGYSLTLRQTLWDSQSWIALDQAHADIVKSQLELNQVRNDLASKLVLAYLQQASAQGDLVLAQQKLAEGNRLLKITEQRFKAGKIKSIDVEEMQANQLNEQSDILQAKLLLAEKQSAFLALINQETGRVDEVDTDQLTEPPLLAVTLAEWLKLAKDHSPALLIASQQVKIRQVEKSLAESGYYPSLESHIGYQDNDDLEQGEMSAGLSLNLPLDLNGSTHAKVGQAELKILYAKQAVRQTEIEITKNIRQRYTQLSLNWQQVGMSKKLVHYREQVLKSKQILFDSGLAEASDVIEAHNALFTAKNDLKTNMYQYWQQRVGLLQATGMLNDQSIAMISAAFKS